jgi:3-oxoacyl-[acyl-carrier protein] reductase
MKGWLAENGQDPSRVYSFNCDLLSSDSIKAFIGDVLEKFERIDILVNCAGAVEEMPFAMMDEKRIGEMLDINLKTTMLLSQGVLKPMFKQKAGAIVNVSSITAIRGGRGIVPYAAAKAGMDSFTRTLASEVGKKNIRVNGIRPGAIRTSMSEALEARVKDYVPNAMIMGRFGEPAEVSKGVLFLASEETASYITGTFINIDGGYMV